MAKGVVGVLMGRDSGVYVDCTIQTALIFISMDTITQSALATRGDCHKDNNNKAGSSSSSRSCRRRQAGRQEMEPEPETTPYIVARLIVRSLTAAAHICHPLCVCVCLSKELLSQDEPL